MTSFPKLGWRVPSSEHERFREFVEERHGDYERYTAFEMESAMREWLNEDDYQDLEELVSRLVKAAGRTPTDYSQKKSVADPLDGDDTTFVQVRINPELKDEFKADTKENSEYGYGVTLAHALRAYRQGGRAKRLEERLGRVADDAEKFLSEFANTDGAETGISLRKKRTIAICNRLSDSQGSEFLESDLYDAIAAIAGDSKPTLQEYEKRVLDRLDVTPHPNNPDLWIPRERADEIVNSTDAPSSDAPAIDHKDYVDLSREEKVEGIQIELARESTTNRGKYQFDASTANQQMFDDNVSPGHIYDLMREAGNSEGFRFTDYNGTKVLRVDLDDVTEQAVIDTLKSDSEAESDGGEKETEGEEQTRVDAESQMDQLLNAEVATDGGTSE